LSKLEENVLSFCQKERTKEKIPHAPERLVAHAPRQADLM
jgi:hypothetical protein